MSKRNTHRRKLTGAPRRKRQVVIAGAVILSLFSGWAMLARSRALNSPAAVTNGPQSQTVSPASFNSNSPSKEYIYAGARLVATEEPDPCSQDTQPPTITCPSNLPRNTDPGQCSAVVTYAAPIVSDNCAGVGAPGCIPASGSPFLKGTTTVNCSVADARGNQASCSFTVTVNDAQAPTITCPANIVRSTDPNQCSAVVTYSTPTVSDNCAGVGTPSCTPISGSAFAKGTTTVNCNVSDASNNSANCTFTVTVNDVQPPTITCPANVTAVTSSFAGSSTVVSYANPTLSDNCAGVTSSCNPPSGSTFAVGSTTVTCTATDTSGNTASCSFPVSVFNICLQDDSNAQNRILINTATGDYRFCCNGTTFTGKGKITIQGSTYTLEHNTLDRRVRATGTGSTSSGTASLQSPPGNLRCSFTDSNLGNNTTCTTCQ